MERVTKQQASNFVLGSVELERLGVFARHGVDNQTVAATERETRVALLGLAGLRDRKGKNPRHRPPRINSPLLRDQIVQSVLFERATTQKQIKAIVAEVGAYYGKSRSYIFGCLKDVAPERRRQIMDSIITSCFWVEGLANLYKLAATPEDNST